jgi:2-polyprenyl-6-methoxyphenol hydroxylase-like FAD-dependent oxidoreductase
MRIGIIGTGIAGCVLAEMLAEDPGIQVDAFDRPEPAAVADAGLILGPNALKALRLHLPDRHDAVRAASLPWRRWSFATATGARLCDLDLLNLAEEPGARLRRSALHHLLRAPLAGLSRHGLTLDMLEEDAIGRLIPVLRTPSGAMVRPAAYDLLVAADDGRHSRLRAITAGPARPRLLGVALTRLLVPDAPDCPFDDHGQWFNGHHRLLAYRLPGGGAHIAGSLPLPAPDAEVAEAARTAELQRLLYTPAEGEPCAAVAWMILALQRHAAEIHWAWMQETPLRRSALGGRVLFLGDAAQAMVPTLDQGASQAIEDGIIAGAVLRRGGTAEDVAAWRDARVEFARRFSLEASDTLFPGCDPVAGSIAKGSGAFRERLQRLWTDVPEPADFRG